MTTLSLFRWPALAVLLFSTLAFAAPAQKPFTGTITYTLTMSGDIPAEVQSLLPKKAHYQVSGKKVRIDMEPNVQGAGAIITDYDKQTMRMQLEIPGARYQMIMDDDLKQQAGAIQDITYTAEKREIAGLPCQKAVVTGPDGEKTEVWFTEKIQVEGQELMWGKLKGFPMEFSKTSQGITMLYSAETVKPGKVKEEAFDMPADYQPVTQEQLMRMFGGMMD